MSSLYIFRGKAATGKTLITNLLSKELKIAVIRKDDIFDTFINNGLPLPSGNSMTYDILAQIIKTNLANNGSLIVDISLAKTAHYEQFLNKINLHDICVKQFLCICSNEKEWRNRIEARIKNPTPNQLFKTVEEAVNYYKNTEIKPLENEFIIDSSNNINELLTAIKLKLKFN